jgi:hypothetical protein
MWYLPTHEREERDRASRRAVRGVIRVGDHRAMLTLFQEGGFPMFFLSLGAPIVSAGLYREPLG